MNKKFFIFAALCLVVGILYFVFPFDIIPDLIALVGWLDDLVVGILGIVGLTVNIFWALGILPSPMENTFSNHSQYGEYREV